MQPEDDPPPHPPHPLRGEQRDPGGYRDEQGECEQGQEDGHDGLPSGLSGAVEYGGAGVADGFLAPGAAVSGAGHQRVVVRCPPLSAADGVADLVGELGHHRVAVDRGRLPSAGRAASRTASSSVRSVPVRPGLRTDRVPYALDLRAEFLLRGAEAAGQVRGGGVVPLAQLAQILAERRADRAERRPGRVVRLRAGCLPYGLVSVRTASRTPPSSVRNSSCAARRPPARAVKADWCSSRRSRRLPSSGVADRVEGQAQRRGAGQRGGEQDQAAGPGDGGPGRQDQPQPVQDRLAGGGQDGQDGAADDRPRGPLGFHAEHVAADDGDDPVGHDREEDRRHDVGGDAARRGDVGGPVVHRGRPERAHHDQGPLDPGGLPAAGQAEREQREDHHPGVEGDGLDDRGPGLVLGAEDVLVLGGQGDGEQAGVEQAEQDRGRVDQAAAGRAAGRRSCG